MSHRMSAADSCLGRPLWVLALLLAIGAVHAAQPAGVPGRDWGDPAGEECVECHRTENPGLTQEWNHSQHGQVGVNCLDCHKAEKGDKDAFVHISAVERAGMGTISEGQKLSYELVRDPKSGKDAAENLQAA